jgi:hypothetical protein
MRNQMNVGLSCYFAAVAMAIGDNCSTFPLIQLSSNLFIINKLTALSGLPRPVSLVFINPRVPEKVPCGGWRKGFEIPRTGGIVRQMLD